ncbi:MAG: hypothetical protein GY862_34975, partial [Gammaproteobacteria bacterium]|nr:hypothetical protein [Gammaproteobacteria bacterium]
MDIEKKFDGNGLVVLLLACPSMQNSESRKAIVKELPHYIANSIEAAASSSVHVLNIVNACMNYPDGLKQLLKILQYFDRNTIQLQKVNKFMGKIMTSVYKTGGPIDKDDTTYIERQADYEVLMHLKLMNFTMFIGSHQQGKTSLIKHISDHILLSGYGFLSIDCTALNAQSEDGWYQSLGECLADQFGKYKYHIIPSPTNSYSWR